MFRRIDNLGFVSLTSWLLGAALGAGAFAVSFITPVPLHLPVALVLVLSSLSARAFLLVVLPVLCCFTAFEAGVAQDTTAVLVSPHTTTGIGSLWPYCLMAFALGAVNWRSLQVRKDDLVLLATLVFVVVAGTILFTASFGTNPVLNKEPLKLCLYMGFAVILVAAIAETLARRSGDIIHAVCFLLITITAHRLMCFLFMDLKDVGGYSYLTVPISVWLAWMSRRAGVPGLFWFALLMFLLSFRMSRTEIALFVLCAPLLFLTAGRLREMLLSGGALFFLVSAWLASSTGYANYLTHKIRFFLALSGGNAGSVGESALVRVYEFLNLVAGFGANLTSLLFGRGIFGFINFDVHFSPAIYYVDAFPEAEYSANKFFHLHFFLTELIFYFGTVGIFLIVWMYGRLLGRMSLISVPFVAYLVFKGMHRTELLVLLPVFHQLLFDVEDRFIGRKTTVPNAGRTRSE